ncbi:MAG: twin-arginine translocase subunit TatC [Candidatus Latescibacteria bacterium]|nr:twin-arginine translocase subunit TatC [Candidatus Latescibacterota bacterium]
MMDDLNPYTEEYTGYGDAYTGAPIKSNSGSASEVSQDIYEQPGIAEIHDSLRYFEINLLDSSQPSSDKSYGKRNVAPLTAVLTEAGRISIHPLGIIEKPPGVSEKVWHSLDSDNLLITAHEIDSHVLDSVLQEETLSGASEREHAGTTVSAASGGSGGDSTSGGEDELDSTEMPFLDHLEEFRWALLKSIFAVVIGMILSWFASEYFIGTITRLAKEAELTLVYNKIMESIMIRLQTALFMGLFVSLPFVFYFLWSFISPGLYKKEKKWVLPVVIGGTVCFFIGASIAYFVIIPFMLTFLKQFMVSDVQDMLSIGDFIGKMLKFTILFGIIFELPMVSAVLAKIGVLKYTWMSKYRKYAIVVIFIIGAVLTPPDPLSQILMAVPLWFLYEISILVARIMGRKTLI